MVVQRLLLATTVAGAASCQANLDIDADARIGCAVATDCPDGWTCDEALGLCTKLGDIPETAPTVITNPIAPLGARFVNQATFSVIISDRNGSAPDAETVTVGLAYTVGALDMAGDCILPDAASTWHDATLNGPVTGLEASPSGTPHDIGWDVLADGQAGTKDLAVATVDVDPGTGTIAPSNIVAWTPCVFVRATATDTSGRTSEPVTTPAFAVGDDPPTVVLAALTGNASRGVAVELTISDSANDISTIELEFQDGATSPWSAARIELGATANILAVAGGTTNVVVWDSDDPVGGIGETTSSQVSLRMRGSDTPDGTSIVYGAWSMPALLLPPVRNQTPPRLDIVSTPRLNTSGGSSPVTIRYRVADDESDPVDVLFEFSQNLGMTWEVCREYRHPLSEGRYDLATAPSQLDGSGGVLHTFTWDPTASGVVPPPSTLLRGTAFDNRAHDGMGGSLALTAQSQIGDVGPLGLVPYASHFAPFASYGSSDINQEVTTGDFNGDGALDLALSVGGSTDAVVVRLNNGDGTFGGQTGITGISPEPAYIATGFIDGDTLLDVVAANSSELFVLLGDGAASWAGTFTLSAPYNVGSFPRNLVVADFNEDGLDDVALNAASSSNVTVMLASASGNGLLVPGTPVPTGVPSLR